MRPAGQSLSPPRARVPPRADADECRRYRLGVASTLFAQAALNAAEAVEQACRRGALGYRSLCCSALVACRRGVESRGSLLATTC